MAVAGLSSPVIEVNDVPIAFAPNSLSYKLGKGDKTVKAQQTGGNIEIVIYENAETKVSMVKFKMLNTKDNFDLTKGWTTNISGNAIRVSEGEMTESFRHMVVTAEPEYMIGADGELEIEFMGTPVL